MLLNTINALVVFVMIFQLILLPLNGNTPLYSQEINRESYATLSPRVLISSNGFQQSYLNQLNTAPRIAESFTTSSVKELFKLDFVENEFRRLDGLEPGEIEKSMGHIYTVGEHCRNSLRALDEISTFKKGDLFDAYHVVKTSGKMWLLRFATLFHDVGKGYPHDQDLMHPDKGANKILAIIENSNLDLSASDINMIRWLILLHHHMTFFTINRDPQDEDTTIEFMAYLEHFSKQEAELAVNMLYLLSYADATGVNMEKPTANYQKTMYFLPYFYRTLMFYIEKNHTPALQNTLKAQKKNWLRSILSGSPDRETESESDKAINTYLDVTPAFIIAPHRIKHIQKQINILKNATAVPQFCVDKLLGENFEPLLEITVSMKNPANLGFLSKLTAIFHLNGLDITRAEINTTEKGIVFDRFLVRYRDNPINANTIQALTEAIGQDIGMVFEQNLSIENLFVFHKKGYLFPAIKKPFFNFNTTVTFEDDSQNSTRMKLQTTDIPGLVHIISAILGGQFGINIQSATIDTKDYQVLDTLRLDFHGKALTPDMRKSIQEYITQFLNNKNQGKAVDDSVISSINIQNKQNLNTLPEQINISI